MFSGFYHDFLRMFSLHLKDTPVGHMGLVGLVGIMVLVSLMGWWVLWFWWVLMVCGSCECHGLGGSGDPRRSGI